jgi:DNA-binding CsgD family transcriptional regulator
VDEQDDQAANGPGQVVLSHGRVQPGQLDLRLITLPLTLAEPGTLRKEGEPLTFSDACLSGEPGGRPKGRAARDRSKRLGRRIFSARVGPSGRAVCLVLFRGPKDDPFSPRDVAVVDAAQRIERAHAPPGLDGLSPRQGQVLSLLCEGLSEKQVARRLDLSVNTVHVYVKALYRAYGVASRAELLSRYLGGAPGDSTAGVPGAPALPGDEPGPDDAGKRVDFVRGGFRAAGNDPAPPRVGRV